MLRLAAFLRAVNVGGTGKLPMAELRKIAEACQFKEVQTYIASGNLVFESSIVADKAKNRLEHALTDHMGKPVVVFVRSAAELSRIIADNPYAMAEGNKLMVILHDEPSRDMIASAKNRSDEELALGEGCLYAHYPSGMGTSKLRIPGAENGTARNMNTIRQMLSLLND